MVEVGSAISVHLRGRTLCTSATSFQVLHVKRLHFTGGRPAEGGGQECRAQSPQKQARWHKLLTCHVDWNHVSANVVAVGDNEYGQCDVSDRKDIAAISAGQCHSVGLRKDGTVVATGLNHGGQCCVSNWKDVVAIATGTCHIVAGVTPSAFARSFCVVPNSSRSFAMRILTTLAFAN